MRLGEAFSKCQHLAGTPLTPRVAQNLATVYLSKGVMATTAIEGNTLTAEEVQKILANEIKLPPSQQYLEQEVRNIANVLNAIYKASAESPEPFRLSSAWLRKQNRLILEDIDCEDHVHPGEFTTRPLAVGNYRGAPPEDVPYLIDRLCDWLNTFLLIVDDPGKTADDRFVHAFFAAAIGHLYIAWIHPFGDGNGRTARALECAVLANSGIVPVVSASLLSDHYNKTRALYYRQLSQASSHADGVMGFIRYAADGFVDMLREQISSVQQMQREIAWISFVHEVFSGETQGDATKRRRTLVLSLPDSPTPSSKLRRLTPELAEMYAAKSQKTVSHDVNKLKKLHLIRQTPEGYVPMIWVMDAFIPPTHQVL
jgi:Fic family protein